MMKILMPELIRNPNAADALLKLSEKFKQKGYFMKDIITGGVYAVDLHGT